MARILDTTVTVDGNTDISWKPARKETPNRATVSVFGGGGNDFGSGTVTLQHSPDGGTTFIDVIDQSGTAVTFTANKTVNFELYGNANNIAAETNKIRLALAGSTAPTLRYIIDDVR